MQQRIIDIWSDLVRHIRPEGEAGGGERPEIGVAQIIEAQDIAVDEELILEEYDKLFWTRLMVITGYEAEHERKYSLGPDIIEECQEVAALPAIEADQWQPLFEPHKYNEEHGPFTLAAYKLSQE